MNNLSGFSVQKCWQCGEKLTGRTDKKFCDSYCRNTYNNRNKASSEQYIGNINSIIRKNRRILMTLCPVGKATVRKEVLDTMGYNFHHFSGLYRSPKPTNQLYFVCYDYAFSAIMQRDIKKVMIVQKQDYFDEYVPNLWP